MAQLYAYAFSSGEGTLLAYGRGTAGEIARMWDNYRFVSATVIIGPADGTGQ